MGKIILIIVVACSLISCESPKGFTYYFNGEDTGLDRLININGYYVAKNSDDSTSYIMFMFYSNGLFRYTRLSNETPNDRYLSSFEDGRKEFHWWVPWGVYKLCPDESIQVQYVIESGQGGCNTFLSKFRIISKTEVERVEYYYYSRKDKHDPKFVKEEIVPTVAHFHPLETKKDFRRCPYLKKKWFIGPSKYSTWRQVP